MFSAIAYDVHLRCAQELILRITLSFHMLAVALGPANRLDGRIYVELLMTEWHRAFSLSMPIPIPIRIPIVAPTPVALRRCPARVSFASCVLPSGPYALGPAFPTSDYDAR
jgi:hypothetical protein